ncbi:MAG: CPBP family intramembrane metalloprotease [Acidobacteria bacterium]|nr:CPBP family intramembrane metalloprotease [Acidobacteriota bacterium]
MKAFLSKWVTRFPILAFLLLTFLITWGCVLYIAAGEAGVLGHKPSILWLALVGQFGPLWAALLLIALQSGRDGLRRLLRSAINFRLDRGVWVVILLFAPAGLLFAFGGFALFNGGHLDFHQIAWPKVVGGVLVGTVIGLLFGGVSEEIGWRGYLLPRLQGRMHPVFSGIIVGVVWALWHLDPEIVATGIQKGWHPFWVEWSKYQANYLLETIPFSIFMTAVFNRTRGSLFAMMLVHSISNAFVAEVWSNWRPIPSSLRAWDTVVAYCIAFACIWAWRKWEVQSAPPETVVPAAKA